MSKIGVISEVSGCVNAKSVDVHEHNGQCFVQSLSIEPINLTEQLASVSFDRQRETSKKAVWNRTLLGGLAGLTLANGRSTLTGAIIGLGSSIDTKADNIYVTLTLLDGSVLYGKTDHKIATLLKNLSPEYSEQDIIALKTEQRRHEKFLDDAPRTYYEVKNEIDEAKARLKELDSLRDAGETFDVRHKAEEEYSELNEWISQRSEVLDELSIRAKAIKGFGSLEKFDEGWQELEKKIDRLNKKIRFPFIKFTLYATSFYFMTNPSVLPENFDKEFVQAVCILFFLFYTPFLIFYLFRLKARKKKQAELQSEYDEYDLSKVDL